MYKKKKKTIYTCIHNDTIYTCRCTMERDTSGNQLGHIIGDFNPLLDFMDETNFLQFIDLITGDQSSDPIVKFCPNFDCEHICGCLLDNQFGSTQGNPFDFQYGIHIQPEF